MQASSPADPTAPARRRGGAGRRQSPRERILAGALSAMGRRGLHKVSIEDICSAAGMSRRTLYRHFDGREAVIAGIAQHIRERFEAELAQAIVARPAVDDRVRVVLAQLTFYGIAHEDTARLVGSEMEFMRDSLVDAFDQYVEMIRLTVEPIFADPALGRAGLTAVGLAGLIVRAAMQALLVPATASQAAVDDFCDVWDLAVNGALSWRARAPAPA
jgi:AcrR family transcriptional regulator